jgi:hypothetical protein
VGNPRAPEEKRVRFERGVDVHIMAIDGTWRRSCIMREVATDGAMLTAKGSIEGLHLNEFFLLLSTTGLAFRRCELAGVNGDELKITFLKASGKKKQHASQAPSSGSAF